MSTEDIKSLEDFTTTVETTTPKQWLKFLEDGENNDTINTILSYIELHKNEGPELKRKSEANERMNDVRQLAYKTAANAIYGYMGTSSSRFYIPEIAEAITAQGAEMVKMSQKMVDNELGLTVLYGDTDSLYVLVDNKIPEDIKKLNDEAIKKWIRVDLSKDFIGPPLVELMHKMARSIGIVSKTHHFSFKQEIIAKRGMFLKSKDEKKEGAKKRYLLWIVDEEGVPKDELFSRGVEIRRSELSPFIKDFLKLWVMDVLKGEKSSTDLMTDLYEFKKKILEAIDNKELHKFCKNVSLTSDFGDYKSFGYHVRGAMLWNNCISNAFNLTPIAIGSKMKVIFVKPKFNFPDTRTDEEKNNKEYKTHPDMDVIERNTVELAKLANIDINVARTITMSRFLELSAISVPTEEKGLPKELWDVFELNKDETLKKMFYEMISVYVDMLEQNVETVKYGVSEIDDIL